MADTLSLLGLPVLCILFALIEEAVGGQYCFRHSSFGTAMYCRYGCCGPSYDRYCCNLSVGIIVGGVIGAIGCISLIATVVCCCVKKQTYRGRVVTPQRANNVTVVHANAAHVTYPGPRPMGYPPPPQYMYPPQPGYKAGPPLPPPPPYMYSDAAYPPAAGPGMGGMGGGMGGGVGGAGGFAAPAAPAYAPNC